MPFRKIRVQVGLLLCEAMFLNAVLFNNEAWCNIQDKHIEELEKIDQSVMRFITWAHSKVPSAIPLRHIIYIRRILYFQTIVNREDKELRRKIYESQKVISTRL